MPERNGAPGTGSPLPPRAHRHALWAILAGVAVLLLALLLRYALQPKRVTTAILDRVGNALGLEITASGLGEYRLRGAPTLVVRDVVAREPGAAAPLLRAGRIYLSVPWSTVRARGSDLTVDRIELDHPVIDLAALQHWLARRPPGKTRIPTLTDGLHVRDGRIVASDWSLSGLQVELRALHPEHPVAAHISGRYRNASVELPFDLDIALSQPGNAAVLGVAGHVSVERATWSMPAWIVLSGRLRIGDGWQLQRSRLAATARYASGKTNVPFALGAAGTLDYRSSVLKLEPAGIAIRGTGAIPDIDASGSMALATALQLHLAGTLREWPVSWPELPPPIGSSHSPLPFELHYAGNSALTDIASLQLRRDAARFDGRFHLPALTGWIDASSNGSPLPPLDGRVTAPRLDIAGAQLRGVEITLDDPAVPGTPAGE